MDFSRFVIGKTTINLTDIYKRNSLRDDDVGLKQHGFCVNSFLLYIKFIFYLLCNDVTSSSAASLHLSFNLRFSHHCGLHSRCVWPPVALLINYPGLPRTGQLLTVPTANALSPGHRCVGMHQRSCCGDNVGKWTD